MTPRAPDIGFPRILAISVLAGTALVPAVTAQTVAVLQPETRDLVRQTTQPAFAEPFFTADLGVKVTGYVEEVKVDIGSRVKAGDVLLTVSVGQRGAVRVEHEY
jgi:multidrug efflux pump subunit AcrA (membrane-fusion protein)